MQRSEQNHGVYCIETHSGSPPARERVFQVYLNNNRDSQPPPPAPKSPGARPLPSLHPITCGLTNEARGVPIGGINGVVSGVNGMNSITVFNYKSTKVPQTSSGERDYLVHERFGKQQTFFAGLTHASRIIWRR